MSVKVRIPTPLRPLAGGNSEVLAEGRSLAEVIESLDSSYRGLKDRLLDESGQLRRFINVYVNEEDVRYLGELKAEVKDGDTISILPAIAGGA